MDCQRVFALRVGRRNVAWNVQLRRWYWDRIALATIPRLPKSKEWRIIPWPTPPEEPKPHGASVYSFILYQAIDPIGLFMQLARMTHLKRPYLNSLISCRHCLRLQVRKRQDVPRKTTTFALCLILKLFLTTARGQWSSPSRASFLTHTHVLRNKPDGMNAVHIKRSSWMTMFRKSCGLSKGEPRERPKQKQHGNGEISLQSRRKRIRLTR